MDATGIDDEADRMIAYLVPSASVLDMPETVGAPLEEDVISQYAVAYASAVRGPTASVFSGASYHKKSGVFDPGEKKEIEIDQIASRESFRPSAMRKLNFLLHILLLLAQGRPISGASKTKLHLCNPLLSIPKRASGRRALSS